VIVGIEECHPAKGPEPKSAGQGKDRRKEGGTDQVGGYSGKQDEQILSQQNTLNADPEQLIKGRVVVRHQRTKDPGKIPVGEFSVEGPPKTVEIPPVVSLGQEELKIQKRPQDGQAGNDREEEIDTG